MDQIQYLLQEFREHRSESTKKMDAILVQTTRTNGRVNALEDTVDIVVQDVNGLKATDNNTKGSNKIIARMINWGVGIVAGILTALFVYYLLNKN